MRRACLTIVALLLLLATSEFASGQALDSLTRRQTRYAVRGMIGENSTVYMADSTLNRFINLAHRVTLMALRGKTGAVVRLNIVTTAGTIRYAIPDTVMQGIVPVVIVDDSAATSVNDQYALKYVPPEQLGSLGSELDPMAFTIEGKNLVLSKSPRTGDTLQTYLIPLGQDLKSDSLLLSVAKEDWAAVTTLAAMWADLADHQLESAKLRWETWNALVGLKK